MLENEDLRTALKRVKNPLGVILAGTALNATLHFDLLARKG
jgi:hypothetical protein